MLKANYHPSPADFALIDVIGLNQICQDGRNQRRNSTISIMRCVLFCLVAFSLLIARARALAGSGDLIVM